MTRFEVMAIPKKEKEKASTTSVCLDLKPSYLANVASEPYLVAYIMPKF